MEKRNLSINRFAGRIKKFQIKFKERCEERFYFQYVELTLKVFQ